jgi:hypothetical protein
MLGMASALGCGGGDMSCLCKKTEFHMGVHDCAYQFCQDDTKAVQAVNWANGACAAFTSGVTTTVSHP